MWLLHVIINNKHVIEDCRLNNFDVFALYIIYTKWVKRCTIERISSNRWIVDIACSLPIRICLFVQAFAYSNAGRIRITLCTRNLLFGLLLLFELFIAVITALFSHYYDYFN